VAASVCYLLDVLRNTKFKPDILAYRRAKLEGSQQQQQQAKATDSSSQAIFLCVLLIVGQNLSSHRDLPRQPII